MRVRTGLTAILLLTCFTTCRKQDEPESFTDESLYGLWQTAASGQDLNNNAVFEASERIAASNGIYWRFLENNLLVFSDRPDSAGLIYKDWYQVDGRKFYQTAPGGAYSDIVELSHDRFIIRTEIGIGTSPEWTELRRL